MSESTESVWRDEGPTMFSIDYVRKSDVSIKIRKAIKELKAEKALRYRIPNIGLYTILISLLIYLILGLMLESFSSQEPTA